MTVFLTKEMIKENKRYYKLIQEKKICIACGRFFSKKIKQDPNDVDLCIECSESCK